MVPCVQLTFSPKRPPLFVWNCYANVEMLLVSLCLASYQLWWVGGGGGGPIPQPLRLQIKSDRSIAIRLLFPPLPVIAVRQWREKDVSNKVCVDLGFAVFLNFSAFYHVLVCALFDHLRACVCI